MIKKIVCASYGSQNSLLTLKYITQLADKLGSEVICLYVKASSYYEGIEYLPTEENSLYKEWFEEIAKREISKIKEGCNKIIVRRGVPYEEILDFAREENADLIAIDRVKITEEYPALSRTIIKLIRQSDIPVLTLNKLPDLFEIKRILVPTGLYDIHSSDFSFALQFSHIFDSHIFHLSILETAEINLPAELVSKFRGDIYENIAKKDIDHKNVEPKVIEAKNASLGISEFVEKNNIDLVVMNTYAGKKGKRKDFIGSNAERVLQTVGCPVITIKPE